MRAGPRRPVCVCVFVVLCLVSSFDLQREGTKCVLRNEGACLPGVFLASPCLSTPGSLRHRSGGEGPPGPGLCELRRGRAAAPPAPGSRSISSAASRGCVCRLPGSSVPEGPVTLGPQDWRPPGREPLPESSELTRGGPL